MIVDDLLGEAESALSECVIADVRIGLGYTAVLLDDRCCGLAGTLMEESRRCCTLLAQAGERELASCYVVLITSLALVNKTLDHLLQLARGVVALIGPTTPLSRVFARYGVSHLFASVVTEPEQALATVSQAGGTQRFKGAVRKVHRQL